MRVSFYLTESSLVGALGGLLFGFDTAVTRNRIDEARSVLELIGFPARRRRIAPPPVPPSG